MAKSMNELDAQLAELEAEIAQLKGTVRVLAEKSDGFLDPRLRFLERYKGDGGADPAGTRTGVEKFQVGDAVFNALLYSLDKTTN